MFAACRTRSKRTVTPTLMFGARRIGIRRAAAATRAFASGVKPVEPTTSGTPRSAQVSAWRADASWVVKSIATSEPSSAFASSSTTRIPAGPAPARTPTSCPTGPPGRSTAPTSDIPSVTRTSRTIFIPIRPAAPVTTTLIMRLSDPLSLRERRISGELQYAEPLHRVADLREVRVGHRRERQPQLAGCLAEQRHRRLDRSRVRLEEHRAVQLRHRNLLLERLREVGLARRHDELLHRARRDVADDRDHPVAAAGDVGEDREVVPGEERDRVLSHLLDELDLPVHVRGGLLDADDRARLDEA